MRSLIRRGLIAAAAASAALTTIGFGGAGTATAVTAVPPAPGSAIYNLNWSGYSATGRWFRFVSTTLTVPARTLPARNNGDAVIQLTRDAGAIPPTATIMVRAGGGAGSVTIATWDGHSQVLRLSPGVGDRLAISIYHNKKGYDYFTASDYTQGISRTVRLTVGRVIYDRAWLAGTVVETVNPPQADTRMWQFTNSHLTTYRGDRGTLTGPWTTRKYIASTGSSSRTTVVASPSGLWNGRANFSIWLRALPRVYTQGLAGYENSTGPFRFVSATLTVPAAQTPAANGGSALITLGHNGGPTPRPHADITVTAGGGPGSVRYATSATSGAFAVSPRPGDRLRLSIYYDKHGHYFLTVVDQARGDTHTVRVNAPYVAQMPLNTAEVLGSVDSAAVTPPTADTRLWRFTATRVTTYSGDRGSVIGPWATRLFFHTVDGTAAGIPVMSASLLGQAGQNFDVWLHRR